MYAMDLEDRDSQNARWLTLFVLISILAHILLVVAIVLVDKYVPKPKLDLSALAPTTVNMLLLPPPQPVQPPPVKRPFMPTAPQANVKPKDTLIESDNDTQLTSRSQKTRENDSVMPDVMSAKYHADDLQNSPNVRAQDQPQVSSTPPTPKQKPQKQQSPTPPKPPQPQAEKTPPQQTPPTTQPPSPNPEKTTAPKPQPVPDNPNGLPVLPPIPGAHTIEPQTPETATQASQMPVASPIMPAVATDVQGRAGLSGQPSPEAMKTELGQYKAKVYRAVGSLWYQKVNQQLQVLPVGIVRIQFTIHSDGTVDTKVLEGGEAAMQMLLSISLNSITGAAPFDPFTDSMKKQVGESYTDDFTFSIYGGG